MTPFLGLLWLWVWIPFSQSQCVLEKEYFCSSIPDGFPEGLTSILFVVTNLGGLNATVFSSPNLASVTSLALANSGITRIEPGAFHAFQRLAKLSLYQNGLTHLSASWLPNPGGLENLTVAQNLISEIGPDTFSGFSNLTTLNLAHNRIRRAGRGSFRPLSKLAWLDLSSNNLTTLTRAAFDGLVTSPTVRLGSNPWNCSCELQDLGLFLQELVNSSLLEDASSVVCHSPPSLEGTHVWNISDFKCATDFLSSPLENGFYYVGLPALLASLAFISCLAFLCWFRTSKREKKQIRPSVEAVDSTASPNSRVDPTAEGQWTETKTRPSETGTVSKTRRLKVRAKSASAVLLRTEFHETKWRNPSLAKTEWEHLYVSLEDHNYDGRNEDLNRFMERWDIQNLEEGHGKPSRAHDEATLIPTEGCMEISRVEVLSEAAKAPLQKNEMSEAAEKGDANDRRSVENLEPFSYLTVATAPQQKKETHPRKDIIKEADEGQMVSLKRALTWPYERNTEKQRLDVFRVRGPFVVQFFKPVFHLNEAGDANEGSGEEWLCMPPKRKDQLPGDRTHEFSGEVTLPKGNEPLCQKESKVAVEDVGRSEFEEEPPGQHGHASLGVHDPRHRGGSKLNLETNPTSSPEVMLQKELGAAAVARCVPTSPPGGKPTRQPTSVKAKRWPQPVSSQSRARQEARPSPMSSVDISGSSSSDKGDVLLESSEYNYMNLLHEVVENRGRWTRERWKQTRRNRALKKSK